MSNPQLPKDIRDGLRYPTSQEVYNAQHVVSSDVPEVKDVEEKAQKLESRITNRSDPRAYEQADMVFRTPMEFLQASNVKRPSTGLFATRAQLNASRHNRLAAENDPNAVQWFLNAALKTITVADFAKIISYGDPAAGIRPARDAFILCIGRRRLGKTVFTRSFMYHMRDIFPSVYIINQTEGFNHSYTGLVPPLCIQSGEVGVVMFNQIQQAVANDPDVFTHAVLAAEEEKPDPRSGLLIVDDSASDRKITHGDELLSMAVNGRQYHLMVFFNSQYMNLVQKAARLNTDAVVLFPADGEAELEASYENYCGSLGVGHEGRAHWKLLNWLLDDLGEGFAIVIFRYIRRSALNEKMFFVKIDPAPDNVAWRMGSDSFWKAWKEKEREQEDSVEFNSVRIYEDMRRRACDLLGL